MATVRAMDGSAVARTTGRGPRSVNAGRGGGRSGLPGLPSLPGLPAAAAQRITRRLALQAPNPTPPPERFGAAQPPQCRALDPNSVDAVQGSAETLAVAETQAVSLDVPETTTAPAAEHSGTYGFVACGESVASLRPRSLKWGVACLGILVVAGAAALVVRGPAGGSAQEPVTVMRASHGAAPHIGAKSVGAKSVGAKSVVAKSVAAKSVGAKSVVAKSVAAKSVVAKSVAAKSRLARAPVSRASVPRRTARVRAKSASAPTTHRKRTARVRHKQTQTGAQDRTRRAVAAPPGYVTIDAAPYATVSIDGRKIGDTPLVRLRLRPGRHTVRGVAADGRVASTTITVRSGATVRKRLRYRK